MDLKSGYPYWPVKNGLTAHFAPLARDLRCDVAIIGGGITGSLIAHALSAAGLDVVILDKRDAGWGSTAASTAMLQYEIDTELADLAKRHGLERAVAIYRACEHAIGKLGDIARGVRGAGFSPAQSLYYASRPWHAGRMRAEGELRQRVGFALDILDRPGLEQRFGISAPAALLTKVAAHVDPYRLALGLLKNLERRGVPVHARTEVLDWHARSRGVTLRTDRRCTVACAHLVIAGGYESQAFLRQRVATNHSSYALVSEPVRGAPRWLAHTLIWESARPYLYLRATTDGRLVMGGEDDTLDVAAKRDRKVDANARRILRKVGKLLPEVGLEAGFAWAGTFAETADGLPFFGPHAEHGPRVHFAMAYGGNGIAYSVIGAELLRARILREPHPLAAFLSFDRLR